MDPFVSVIMPAFNIKSLLELNLYSLYQQDYPPGRLEVIVVDDGSNDGTVSMCDNLDTPYNLKVIRSAKNLGRAGARNLGISAAEGDIVIFCDGDTLQPPGFIKTHLEQHARCHNLVLGSLPRFSARCYTHYFENYTITQMIEFRKLHPEWKGPTNGINRILEPQDMLQDFDRVERLTIYQEMHTYARIVREFGELGDLDLDWMVMITRNVSLRRDMLLASGGFDENFKGYGLEDWDLGYRLKELGARFDCRKSVINYHQEHFVSNYNGVEEKDNARYFFTKHNSPEIFLLLRNYGYNWWVYNYSRLLLQYRDLKLKEENRDILAEYSRLSQAFINEKLDRQPGSDLPLDILSLRRHHTRLSHTHPEFAETLGILIDWNLERRDPPFISFSFHPDDLQSMQKRAATLAENKGCTSIDDQPDAAWWLQKLCSCRMPSGWPVDEGMAIPACFDEGRKLAYQEILLPFIWLARDRTDALSPGGHSRLSGPASLTSPQRLLLQCLSHVARPTLDQEFAYFDRGADRLGRRPTEGIETRYPGFVNYCFRDGWPSILFTYPVLGRLLITLVEHWARTAASRIEQVDDQGIVEGVELTSTYQVLFQQGLEPRFMRRGEERSRELERLASKSDVPGPAGSILKLEEMVLNMQGPSLFDIPL
ncbi:MAG: glycosyltransferase [Syntrophomonas sp.]